MPQSQRPKSPIKTITKPALKRIAHRAGVKSVSSLVYEEVRTILDCELRELLSKVVFVAEADRVKTIDVKHVKAGAKACGMDIVYGKHVKEDTNLGLYQQKVLKQVHNELGQKKETLDLVGNMMIHLIEKIMDNANQLKKLKNTKTLTSREVQTAVRMTLKGNILVNAVNEGTRAVQRYAQEGNENEKRKNRSSKAGLSVSVSRIEKLMRVLSNYERLGAGAPFYLAAVIEYLLAEIYELAGNEAKDNKKIRIKPRHVFFAVFNDNEMSPLFKHTIMSVGVMPNIHVELLPK